MTPSLFFSLIQAEPGSFRPYLYVLLAFAAGWLIVGAWVYVIGRRVRGLADLIERDPSGEA